MAFSRFEMFHPLPAWKQEFQRNTRCLIIVKYYTQSTPRGCGGMSGNSVYACIPLTHAHTHTHTHTCGYVVSRRDALNKLLNKTNRATQGAQGLVCRAFVARYQTRRGSLFKCFRARSRAPPRAAPDRWRVARCRVSAAAAMACAKRRNYYALDAPKTDPTIRTEKERIAVGETLRVNCISGKSRPASTVTWKLNGNRVSISPSRVHMCARVWTCPRNFRGYVTPLGD